MTSTDLLFVRIPKNASTSVFQHLGEKNAVYREKDKLIKNLSKPLYMGIFDPTHATPKEIIEVIPDANDFLSFAIVRNPWDRMVSMYLFAQRKRLWWVMGMQHAPSFEDFCELTFQKFNSKSPSFFPSIPQSRWLSGGFNVKEILRFESLQENFNSFLIKHGITDIAPDLPILNSGKRKDDYRDFFTKRSGQIVEIVYDEDIKAFNYSF